MVHIVFIIAVLLAYMSRKKGKILLIMSFFILFLFSALRYMYGNDYPGYLSEFNKIKLGIRSLYSEQLFIYLNRISPSFFFMIAVISGVFVLTIYLLVTRNLSKRYAWLGLFIFVVSPYLFLMNLSAIRQCIAMLLFIAAIPYGMKRKPIPFCLLLFIGTQFHKSAFLLFPVYFILSPKPFRRRNVLLVLAALAIMFQLSATNDVALWIARQFDDSNYVHYASGELGNSLRATLLSGIYFVYVLLNMDKLEGKKLIYAKLALVSYSMSILAYQLSLFTRVQMYFDIFTIVAIPTIIERVNAEGKIYINRANPQETVWKCINKYVLPALIIAIYFLRYYSFFTNPMWSSFADYQTIFSAP